MGWEWSVRRSDGPTSIDERLDRREGDDTFVAAARSIGRRCNEEDGCFKELVSEEVQRPLVHGFGLIVGELVELLWYRPDS